MLFIQKHSEKCDAYARDTSLSIVAQRREEQGYDIVTENLNGKCFCVAAKCGSIETLVDPAFFGI